MSITSLEKAIERSIAEKIRTTVGYALKEGARKTCVDMLKWFNEEDPQFKQLKMQYSLTGSLATSFKVGVYKDGILKYTKSITEVGVKEATNTMVFVGDKFDFEDYSSGETPKFSNEYIHNYSDPNLSWNIHSMKGMSGDEATERVLQDYKPSITKGYTLTFACGVPYVDFYQKRAGWKIATVYMSILRSHLDDIKNNFRPRNNGGKNL